MLLAAAVGLGALMVAARVPNGQGVSVEVVEATVPALRATPQVANGQHAEPDVTNVLQYGERNKPIPPTQGNAFGPQSWLPPPPPAPKPVPVMPPPPPLPVAPALPFTYIGMVERGAGKPQAFLARGEALLIVTDGDVIENSTYRVDSLSPTAVVLTYLPIDQQQTLNASGASR